MSPECQAEGRPFYCTPECAQDDKGRRNAALAEDTKRYYKHVAHVEKVTGKKVKPRAVFRPWKDDE